MGQNRLIKVFFILGLVSVLSTCSWKKPTSILPKRIIEQLNQDPESALICPKNYLLSCILYSLEEIVKNRTLFEVYRLKDNLPPEFVKDHWSEIEEHIHTLTKSTKQRRKEAFPVVSYPKTIPMSYETNIGKIKSEGGGLWLGPEVFPKSALMAFRPFKNGLPIYSFQKSKRLTINGPHSFHIIDLKKFPELTTKNYFFKKETLPLSYHYPINESTSQFYFSLLGGGFYESKFSNNQNELHFIKNLAHAATRSISQNPQGPNGKDQLHILGWSGLNKNIEVNSYFFSKKNQSFAHYLENGPTLATTSYKGESISFVDFNEAGHNEEKLFEDFSVIPAFNHSMLHFTPSHLQSPTTIFSGLGNLKRTEIRKKIIKSKCINGNSKITDCDWFDFKEKYQSFETCFEAAKSSEAKVKCISIFEGKIGITKSIPKSRAPQVYIGSKKEPHHKASQLLKDLPQIYDMRGYGRENTFGALLLNELGIYYISLYPTARLTRLFKNEAHEFTGKSFVLLDIDNDKKKEIIFLVDYNRLAIFQDPLQTWTQRTSARQVYQSLDF